MARKTLGQIISVTHCYKLYMNRLGLAVLTAFTSLASVAQTERLELPDMGASADTILSRAEEAEYAKSLVRQMRAF